MPSRPSRRTVLRGTLGATGATLLGGCRTDPTRDLGHGTARPPDASARLVAIRLQVNDQQRTAEVDVDASALELVREQLGLRGSKLACGHGVAWRATTVA